MTTMREVLLYFCWKYNSDWEKIFQALNDKEKIKEKEIKSISQKFENNYISIIDEDYPKKLFKKTTPPFIIFTRGNKKLLKNKLLSWNIDKIEKKDISKIIKFKKNLDFDENYSIIIKQSEEFREEFLKIFYFKKIIFLKEREIGDLMFLTKEKEEEIIKHNGLIISLFASSELDYKKSKNLNDNFCKQLIDFKIMHITKPKSNINNSFIFKKNKK